MKKSTTEVEPDVQLQIRMPPSLHDKLRRKAFKERRSLAAVARLMIERGFKAERQVSP